MSQVPSSGKKKKEAQAVTLQVKYLSEHAEGSVVRMTPGAAGLDLVVASLPRCCGPLRIVPGHVTTVGTGVAVAIPEGYCGIVLIRSGVNRNNGLRLDGGAYLIDADYRGEIMLPVTCSSDYGTLVEIGERIAQLLIVPYLPVAVEVVDALPESFRGVEGFGSTGK